MNKFGVSCVYSCKSVIKHDFISSGNNWLFVRWRKPRWVLARPSKLFVVREKPKQDPDEQLRLLQMNRIFNTNMRSTLSFIRSHNNVEVMAMLASGPSRYDVKLPGEDLEDHLAHRAKKLKNFNATSQQFREEFLAAEAVQKAKEVAKESALQEANEVVQKQIAIDTVQQLLEQSKQFYNEDNMEELIAEMLTKKKNYNFVIDLDGNRYVELDDLSLHLVEPEEKPSVQ